MRTMSVLASLPPSLRGAVAALLPHRFALVALAVFMIAGIAFADDGANPDAELARLMGIANIEYVLGDDEFFTDGLSPELKFYGSAILAPLILIERVLNIEESRHIFSSRNLLLHILFLAGGLSAYLLAIRLFNNKLLALFAMLLFLLHPRLYEGSFGSPFDIPFLSMFMISLSLTYRVFQKDSIWGYALLGTCAGILVNIRIMGVVFVSAILAVQAVRLLLAYGNARKERIFLIGVVFALSSGLMTYATLPYLWPDPAPRVIDWWTTMSQFPKDAQELFQVEVISSQSAPAEYIPVWFLITTHPFALLLGFFGGVAGFRRVAALKTQISQDAELWLWMLVIAISAIPFVAVALLTPTVYGGWRHMYFIWAPFSLLGVLGLHWLLERMPRTRLRALTYGVAGTGLVSTLATVAVLYPFHSFYFNFFVDRTGNEPITAQYRTNSWKGLDVAVQSLLDLRSTSQVSVVYDRGAAASRLILPEADRNRLVFTNEATAEFSIERGSATMSEEALYTATVYNGALWAVMEREPGENPYAAIHAAAVSGEPIARSEYDIYLNRSEHALIYIKEPCSRDVLRGEFFLLIFPQNTDVLAGQERVFGRANAPFLFYDYGSAFDGKCVAKLPLPDYDIEAIQTGQARTIYGDPRWEAAFPYQHPSVYRAAYRAAGDTEPSARAAFNVYISQDETTLTYAREPCALPDVEDPFFIHVAPESESDLPTNRRQYGFDNWGFEFLLRGIIFDHKCVAQAPLPTYPIASLRTGQFIRGEGEVWSALLLFENR